MKVTIDGELFEFNNEKLRDIYELQKSYIGDILDACDKRKDMQALLYHIISLNSITEALFEGALGACNREDIIKLLLGGDSKCLQENGQIS